MKNKIKKILLDNDLSDIEKLKQIDLLKSEGYCKRRKPTNITAKKKKRKK